MRFSSSSSFLVLAATVLVVLSKNDAVADAFAGLASNPAVTRGAVGPPMTTRRHRSSSSHHYATDHANTRLERTVPSLSARSQPRSHRKPGSWSSSSTSALSMTTMSIAPIISQIPWPVWTCGVPPLLGYIKNEYGVSYAYGFATSLTAWQVLRNILAVGGQPSALGFTIAAHAAALVFYGARLNAFLLYREICVKEMRELRERIEERAKARGNRLSRTPALLSYGLLYFGLCAPVFLTSQLVTTGGGVGGGTIIRGLQHPWSVVVNSLFKACVSLTWFGFGVAALGDLQKSLCKAIKGQDHLVKSGIFRLLRHPNYTGEIVGWTSSFAAGIIAAFACPWKTAVPLAVTSLLGVFGIDLVLLQATRRLEEKQQERYGELPEYKDWIGKSWAGFRLPQSKPSTATQVGAQHEVEPDISDEDAGTGI